MDHGPLEKLLADLLDAEVRFLLIDRDPANVQCMLDVLVQFGDGHAAEFELTDFGDQEGSVRYVDVYPQFKQRGLKSLRERAQDPIHPSPAGQQASE